MSVTTRLLRCSINSAQLKASAKNLRLLWFANQKRLEDPRPRTFSTTVSRRQSQPAAAAPPQNVLTVSSPTGADKVYDPKLVKIVSDISKLTLLEVSELNECLKKTLNIPDAPMMVPGMMAGGGFGGGGGGAAQEEEEAAPVKVQTNFTVKLLKFDDGKKVALIKELKGLLEGMNLVQAKKFVESAPTVVKADIPKDEAEKLAAALTAVGATCEIS